MEVLKFSEMRLKKDKVVFQLPIHKIRSNPYQPRKYFNRTALEELADSIRAYGILQPITVRKMSGGAYELVAGQRRLRAAELEANRIVWLQPDRQSLTFGTEGSEWTLSASEGVALTPSNVSFEMQTANGGDNATQAVSVGGGVLYLQRGGKAAFVRGHDRGGVSQNLAPARSLHGVHQLVFRHPLLPRKLILDGKKVVRVGKPQRLQHRAAGQLQPIGGVF